MISPGSPLARLNLRLGLPNLLPHVIAEPPQGDADAGVGVHRLVVLFDRDCGVCQETVRALRRWDHGRRLEFIAFQDAAVSGRADLERIAKERALDEELHVLDVETGEVTAGGLAALAILDVLPGGWLLRPWSALPSTTVAADLLYRLAARHRDTVGWLVGLRDEVACPSSRSVVDASSRAPVAPPSALA